MKDDHHNYIHNFCNCEKKKSVGFAIAKGAFITAMIILPLILHSAVHIYDFHIFITSQECELYVPQLNSLSAMKSNNETKLIRRNITMGKKTSRIKCVTQRDNIR